MSRLQDGAADTNFTSFAAVTAYPFTMAVWFKQTTPSDSTVRNLISIGVSGSNNNRWSISVLGNGETNLNSRTTTDASINSGVLANDTNWHLVIAVCTSATDRKLYTDSVTNVVSDTTSSTPTGMNRMRVGGNFTTPNLLFNGYTAHPAVWNVALGADQVAQLFNRASPMQVRPDALVFYVPFFGRSSATSDADITSAARTLDTNDAATASNEDPPVYWAPQKRKGYIVSSAAGGVPAFSVTPTVTSQSDVQYTLSATPDQSATWYVAVTPAGTATPSKAQIKTGTGGGIVAAANKAVTGADTINVGGSLTFPLYDIHSLLSNGGGDGNIATIEDSFLDPPTGKQFMVFDVPLSGTAIDALVNASPPIADGDVFVIDTVTDPGLYAVSASAQGDVDVNVMGDSSRQLIDFDVYDLSAQAYYGAGVLAINNQGPDVIGNPAELDRLIFDRNETITPVDLTVYFDDPELDVLVVTTTDTGFDDLNLDITDSDLSGTVPNANSITTGLTIRGTDPYGGFVEGDLTIIVGDVVVPNVVGQDSSSGANTLAQAYLGSEVVASIPSLQPPGTILIQNPAAASEVPPNTVVQLTVASGAQPQPAVKTRLQDFPEVITKRRRRRIV